MRPIHILVRQIFLPKTMYLFITISILPLSILLPTFIAANGNNVDGDFYSYKVHDANGDLIALDRYRGKVSLVVNVASRCGYTDGHYNELVELYNTLGGARGDFQPLAFPCNQFGKQEPSDISVILQFVKHSYDVTFPVFAKIDVVGDNADPSFKELIRQTDQPPSWNFWKYLINGDGRVVGAWGPSVSVKSLRSTIEAEIERLHDNKNRADL